MAREAATARTYFDVDERGLKLAPVQCEARAVSPHGEAVPGSEDRHMIAAAALRELRNYTRRASVLWSVNLGHQPALGQACGRSQAKPKRRRRMSDGNSGMRWGSRVRRVLVAVGSAVGLVLAFSARIC
jgi:hypothetical protein